MNSIPSSSTPYRAPSAPALALLAARAAVALELAANARETQWTEVRELGSVLGSLVAPTAPAEPVPARQALVQTEAATVVDRALALSGDRRPTTVAELSDEIDRLAAALKDASPRTTTDELKRLRDLCLALARAAQAQEPAPLYARPGAGAQR